MNLRYAIKSWAQATAGWRWRAAWLTAFKPDASDALWMALAAHRGAIKAQATAMAAGFDEGASVPGRSGNIARGLAALIRRVDAETDSMAGGLISQRAYPVPVIVPTPGRGGLGQAAAAPKAAATVWTWVRRAGVALGILAATPIVLPLAGAAYRAAWRNFVETEEERRRREQDEARARRRGHQEDLTDCANSPNPAACRQQVNDDYEAFAPCKGDILDTPLGSTLGTLVGIGGGYAGMRWLMGRGG